MRADWQVTIMSGGPKWYELFLILYRTPFSSELKVNKTDAVTVCLFRILTFEQIILNPGTVAKHLVILTVLKHSCVVICASCQPNTAAGESAAHTNILVQA